MKRPTTDRRGHLRRRPRPRRLRQRRQVRHDVRAVARCGGHHRRCGERPRRAAASTTAGATTSAGRRPRPPARRLADAGQGRRPAATWSSASRRTSRTSGYKDPTTGEYSGFDIEIARLIAAGLGFDADKIEYKAIPSANREDEISAGNIDYYVGTYSITDTRKERVVLRRPVLHRRPGPAGPQGRHEHHRAGLAEGQDDLLGHRVDVAEADQGGVRRRRRSSWRSTRCASTSCSTSRSTRSPPTTRSSRATPRRIRTTSRWSASRSPRSATASASPRATSALCEQINDLLETGPQRRLVAEDLRRDARQERLDGHAAARPTPAADRR